MRISAALLAAALLAAQGCGPAAKAPPPPAGSRPTAADDEAVMRGLFRHLAAPPHPPGLTCVAAELRARHLDPFPDVVQAGPDANWISIPDSTAPVPGELRRAFAATAERALHDPEPARIARLERAWVPAPLGYAPPDVRCHTVIAFAPPSIRGDLAYVLMASACGPECGSGELFALRRERGGWRPLAWLPLWIS